MLATCLAGCIPEWDALMLCVVSQPCPNPVAEFFDIITNPPLACDPEAADFDTCING